MNRLLTFFRRKPDTSASVAKERLQIILAHERADRDEPEFLPRLQKELLAVIAKYVNIDQEQLNVGVQRNGQTAVLEINVELSPKR